MFWHSLNIEMKLLRRRGTWSSFVLIVILIGLATWIGQQEKNSIQDSVLQVIGEEAQEKREFTAQLDSIERGLKPDANPRFSPKNPYSLVFSSKAYAIKKMPALTVLSIGENDLFSHAAEVTSFDYNRISQSEIGNPEAQRYGYFDLAFFFTILLPLLIIGYNYDIISGERETGRLSLIFVQSANSVRWLFTKLAIRFSVLFAITWCGTIAFLLLLTDTPIDFSFFIFTCFLIAYIVFWLLLATLSNLFIGKSTNNAFALVVYWLAVVVVLPMTTSMLSEALFPTPSRLLYVTTYRDAVSHAEKINRDSLVNTYFTDHPELAAHKSSASISDEWKTNFQFFKWVLAYGETVASDVRPLRTQFNDQRNAQEIVARKLAALSPSQQMHDGLQHLAGSSAFHHHQFQKQMFDFIEQQWLPWLHERIFKEQQLTVTDLKSRPEFSYEPPGMSYTYWSLTFLILYNIVLLMALFAAIGLKLRPISVLQTNL